MRPRQLPQSWLMTDERLGDALLPAICRMPRGAGIVFRHHATPLAERRALFGAARRIARARGLMLVLAGPLRRAVAWGADGVHGRHAGRCAGPVPRGLLRTMPVHDAREAITARRAGAALAFVSPVHPTRSHPGARTLGRVGFARLARLAGVPAVALGGMDATRARRLLDAYGWAGIDAWGDTPGRGDPRR